MSNTELYKLAKAHFSMDTILSEYDLIDNELKELRKRKIKKILEQQYALETLGDYYKGLKMIQAQNNCKLKLATAKDHNNLFCFITINPKPSVTLPQCVKKVEKLVNRKLFKDYLYVYEQRGTDPESMGRGFHCHILAQRNLSYKPSKVRDCIKNTCKILVSNVNNKNTLNIQHIGENWAVDKRTYILGKKEGEGKDIKQDFDKIWRSKNNLKVYYNNAEDLHQENAQSQAPYGENSQ